MGGVGSRGWVAPGRRLLLGGIGRVGVGVGIGVEVEALILDGDFVFSHCSHLFFTV